MPRAKTLAFLIPFWVAGCSLTEPTYQDISPGQLEQIAARVGTDVATLFREDRELLKTEISEDLGMKVDALTIPSVEEIRAAIPEGEPITPDDLAKALKEQGLVAEIEPATEAALKEAGSGAVENPSKEGLLKALLWGGGGTLLAGGLGLRGRKRRKKKAVAS